ncbi:enoyl-CoA hydratase-related protein [Roseateles depolymerans]|uniref:Enoyl-CoA hydratase n=1 Tax=Roseateles depolymerans TaxID=76731 RepID=A0A0U3MR03_9BURK|nr:enoyl-CoA hydratase-related protein [Roseateles depolymerans]ALV05379.1 enoyl-CoA hydratase [Roseateles depolymerans]REG14605.1 enoyl-CoA hydratase [Roseateles depolymerans]
MDCFSLTEDAGVAHLVMNRPAEMNTMSPQMWRELETLLDQMHRSTTVRALVISSTGRHFSAGMSLDVFKNGGVQLDDRTAEGRASIVDLLADMQQAFNRLDDLRVPTVAAIHGGCIGGAVDLVAACDIRLASSDAFFCIQEINIGMTADLGTLQRLPKLMPLGVVKELAYTGRRMPASRALAVGLVNEVLDTQAACVEAALACAREIAQKPPVAVWGSKQAMHYARDHGVKDSLQQMGWLQAAIWQNANLMEAFAAAQAKRPAVFPDLAPLKFFREG